MSQLLRPGETGLFIFTKGHCFEIDKEGSFGHTGWWKVNLLRRVDWIFIYYRDKKDFSKIFMARCGDLQGPNEYGKYLLSFRDPKLVGYTNANWVDFGGGTGKALRYVD
jgi:hypothetical protein